VFRKLSDGGVRALQAVLKILITILYSEKIEWVLKNY
jgi:hypothetical protein